MQNNENSPNQDERQIAELFSQVKTAKIEAPPYLKTRVLARLREEQRYAKRLFFWKLVSAGSLCSLLVVGLIAFRSIALRPADGVTQQAYVIHVDFNQEDKNLVAMAEVELPEDVHFVSSIQTVREEKKLKLPVHVLAEGRGKLPFVVTSEFSGMKEIKVRLLNEKDELVREQVMKVKFAKQGASVTF